MQSHDTRKKRLKELIYSNRYLFLQAYWLLYLPWFAYLEKTVTKHFHIIHMKLDDYIPFLPVFVIPYFLWFGYVAVAFVNIYLHDKNKKDLSVSVYRNDRFPHRIYDLSERTSAPQQCDIG